jgi:hypothetical protein
MQIDCTTNILVYINNQQLKSYSDFSEWTQQLKEIAIKLKNIKKNAKF